MTNRFRWGHVFIFIVTGFVLGTSFYLQYIEALSPCPLCLMQRGMTVLILCFSFLGMFSSKPPRRRMIVGLVSFFAFAGAFFAVRQLWLQSLPVVDTGMCLPGIETLIYKLPWHEVLHAFVWGGSTGCGEITWTFVGLSMAAWSLMYFSLIGIFDLFLGVKCLRDERV
jgi:protein dithiol:quinone oxidoreductase